MREKKANWASAERTYLHLRETRRHARRVFYVFILLIQNEAGDPYIHTLALDLLGHLSALDPPLDLLDPEEFKN